MAIIEKLEQIFGFTFKEVATLKALRQFHHPNAFCRNEAGELMGLCACGNDQMALRLPVEDLQALEYLNLSDTASLKKITIEGALPQLQHLDISDCKLQKLELPAGFGKLRDLYLQGNGLTEVLLEEALPSLRLLDLSNNKSLSTLPEKLLASKQLQYLYVYGSPILLGEENLSEQRGNAWEKIRTYLSEFVKGQKINYRAKMIVVGNGRVGKTSMIKVLQGGDYDPKEKYTHGISLGRMEQEHLDDIEAVDFSMQVWDFGGQEIFYATHQFFLTNNALYLLAWTSEENVKKYREAMASDPLAVTFDKKWRPEQNWLENIRTYAASAPILMVQTHCDETRSPLRPEFQDAPYQVAPCNFSASKKTGLQDLKYLIVEQLKQLPYFGKEYPKTYDNVIGEIERIKKDQPHIDKQNFLKICATAKIDPGNEERLLEYLNDTGLCVYYPNNQQLADKIFINPEWLTKWVYALLNKKLQDKNGKMEQGYIDTQLLNLKKAGHIAIASEDLIALLQQFKLIFETEEKNETTGLVQKYYIYPDYLPEQLEGDARKFYRKAKNKLTKAFSLRFINYLPENVLINIISHYGPDTTDDVVWKNGISFTNAQGKEAIIEFDPTSAQFEVYTGEGPAAEMLQGEICRKLDELGRHTKMEIALNPADGFLEWDILNNPQIMMDFQSAEDPECFEIRNKAGKSFRYIQLAHLVSEHGSFLKSRSKKPKLKPKPAELPTAKIYFSYANNSTESGPQTRMIEDLYLSLKNDGFDVHRSADKAHGTSIDTYISDLSKGDLVLIFITHVYFLSDQSMRELYAIAKDCGYKKDIFQGKILPVPFELIDFKDPKRLGHYKRHWKERMNDWKGLISEDHLEGHQKYESEQYQFAKNMYQADFSNLIAFLADIKQEPIDVLADNSFERLKLLILDRLQNINPNWNNDRVDLHRIIGYLELMNQKMYGIEDSLEKLPERLKSDLESVFRRADTGAISEAKMLESIQAIQKAMEENTAKLPEDIEKVWENSQLQSTDDLDVKGKFKLSIPIVPLFIKYEKEISTDLVKVGRSIWRKGIIF